MLLNFQFLTDFKSFEIQNKNPTKKMYTLKRPLISKLSLLLFIMIIQSLCSKANNTLDQTQQLLVDQSLVSAKKIFEFGFFNPNGSRNLYLGMWYKNIPIRKIVWVANRDRPLVPGDSESTLKIGTDGNLRLLDGKQNTVWFTNITVQSNNTVAVLQDDGNLILKDSVLGSTLWESFIYPCDTLLMGMKVGENRQTGEHHYLTSWKAENDPAPGQFKTALSEEEPPQFITWNNSTPYWRSGPWNGFEFLGLLFSRKGYASGVNIISNDEQGTKYLSYNPENDGKIRIIRLTPSGSLSYLVWTEQNNEWFERRKVPSSRCDIYGACGAFGICTDNESIICQCLKGFVPRSDVEWSKGNWRGGCVRRTPLLCERNTNISDTKLSDNDRFQNLNRIKLPSNYAYFININDAIGCEKQCLSNCSCVAYAYPVGLRCMIWEGNLIDSQLLTTSEETIFIRLAYSEIDIPGGDNTKIMVIIISTTCTVISIILLVVFIYFIRRRKASQRGGRSKGAKDFLLNDLSRNEFPTSPEELPVFEFAQIVASTDNFSQANKLGEGGFGSVYKGILIENGKLIAVKRLSSHSGQGNNEFKNEIVLISKLQHRNLVRLLGFCIHGEEKLLIYEYMKNNSLDAFIFDSTKRLELDWKKRFHIIQGIASGILYLHHDSSLRVIHRDLKASNVLLDDDMNPKISDFGLARSFKFTQEQVNTHRVVGTFGYMSPEYATWGIFSEKSDVYSFGILLLEIVSGRKNTGFYMDINNNSLISYAWKSWKEQKGIDLLDQSLVDLSSHSEVNKCVQIGLLCVQDQPADRPTMFDVVHMLSRETNLPQPKQPMYSPQKWLDSNTGLSPNLCSVIPDDTSLIEGR